jgi:heterodisulfide reductase subunit C
VCGVACAGGAGSSASNASAFACADGQIPCDAIVRRGRAAGGGGSFVLAPGGRLDDPAQPASSGYADDAGFAAAFAAALGGLLGPAALAKAYRFVGDARDQDTRERLRDLNGAHGIWDCTRCYFCNQRCPKHVDPRDAIAKLGAESFKEGFTRDEGAKHAKVFVDSTFKGGYLRETELVPKTIGPVNAIKDIPFALQLARAGKVPNPLSPHKAKDNDEVKRLWKLLEKEAKGQPRRATATHPDAVQGD